MPFVRITVHGPALTPEQIRHLQDATTDLMEQALGKVGALTSVLVEQPAAAGWTIGRRAVGVAAHVHATVTAGTNSADEKARFIQAEMEVLKAVLGPELQPATYVVVDEVPAQSWGYDGRTQDSRRQTAA
ncbi:MAG: tautomerase family protein [Rhodopseudomonas palustris]|uniref:Tautomerase family protein n=1 Tax=Rhodopseudomonas palustris TaxID=1076 RepID=A0A933RU05_RHOPL|nr:tautomerase family protein [Rhodopseudomonas palustris]